MTRIIAATATDNSAIGPDWNAVAESRMDALLPKPWTEMSRNGKNVAATSSTSMASVSAMILIPALRLGAISTKWQRAQTARSRHPGVRARYSASQCGQAISSDRSLTP